MTRRLERPRRGLPRRARRTREGADLDLVVEWARRAAARRSTSRPAAATSRGGCARQGCEVVTLRPRAGHARRT